MSSVLERINAVASIEQIEAELVTLREAIATTQKQVDSLELFHRVLVTARDGKPPKTWSRKRGASKTDPAVEAESADDDIDEPHPAEAEQSLTANQQAVIDVIRLRGAMTVGEVSHAIKIPYASAYGSITKLIERRLLMKSGDKIHLTSNA